MEGTTNNTQVDIIQRPIPGISAKTLIWFFVGIFSVIITVLSTYFNLCAKIDAVSNVKNDIITTNYKVELNSTEIKDIQQKEFPAFDIRMSVIEAKINDLLTK